MGSKFKCLQCNYLNQLNTVTTVDGYFNAKNFPRKKVKACCSVCDSEKLELQVDNVSLDNIQLGKFSSLDPNQKRAYLKKRSHEHFERKIKEVKLDMHKNYKP